MFKCSSTVFLVLFFLLFSPHAFSQDKSLSRKSLVRVHDSVIITGEKLEPLIGTRIDHLALYRYSNDSFELVPF